MANMDLTYNRYSKLIGCDKFDQDMLMQTETLAMGLSYTEALAYWGVTEDELNPAEKRYFRTAYDRGVVQAKHLATQKLFASMSDKNGGQVAMQYLKMFGERFPADSEGASGSNFHLRVVKNGVEDYVG